MKKRIFSLFLMLSFCLSLLPAAAFAAEVDDDDTPIVSNNSGGLSDITGSGTEEDPYQISTADQMYAFAEWYNENVADLLSNSTNTYAELTADIALNQDGDTPRVWTPIGTISTDFGTALPYLGEFNGNGHTISGLYIEETSTTAAACGLFGYLAGSLHDLNLENVSISSKSACTGSFAGILEGTIENCSSDNAVITSDAVARALNGTGGIVGNLNGTASEVLNCTFSGSVTAAGNPYIGGIVGCNVYGHVADCVNNGAVISTYWDKVGGIVGNNEVPDSTDDPIEGRSAVIERCINNGNISGVHNQDYVGGIAGMSAWGNDTYACVIRDCINTGTLNGQTVGGIVGWLSATTKVENCVNIGTVTGTEPLGGIAGQHLTGASIANSYYQQAGDLHIAGMLGSTDGREIPTEDEKFPEEQACVTADQLASGEVAWKLNTANGTNDSSGSWTQKNGEPSLVSGSDKATCQVIFEISNSEKDEKIIAYTSAEGKVSIPDELKDKNLIYMQDNETKIFTENTIVDKDLTVMVSDKPIGEAPVFANNTDTLSAADDKETVFTLENEPAEGTIFRIYSAETDGEIAGTAVWSGKTLTITLNAIPSAQTTYYVSMTTPLSKESPRSAVIVNPYVKPSSGGSSSGGSSSSTTYPISTPTKTDNGSVTVSTKNAKKGETVTITVTPDLGCTLETISVTDKNGKALTVTKKSDTQYTFTMPNGKVTITPTFTKIKDEKPSYTGYDDVSSSHWYHDAVQYVTEKGLMSGTGSNRFSPNDSTTRGMLMTVLARYAGQDTTGSTPWYQAGMDWAKANGISDGTNPTVNITREQLVTMLYRYAGSPAASGSLNDFSDAASISSYAVNAMQWAVANGIVNGSNGKLNPKNSATRAEVAAILMRFCENTAK